MHTIAGQFQDTKYLAAARRFRLPFWDWHKPRAKKPVVFQGVKKDGATDFTYDFGLPRVFQESTLLICSPDPNNRDNEVKAVPFPNPLLTYYFPKSGSISSDDWKALDTSDIAAKVCDERHLEQMVVKALTILVYV